MSELETEQISLELDENKRKLKGILEGLLFIVGEEGLTAGQAASATECKEEECEKILDELCKEYVEDDSRGIEVANYGGVYRFLSKEYVTASAKRLFQMNKQSTLSQAALETLAIIAYKQPITRVEIEEIRGVGADVMIRKLEARGFIKEDGRSDAPGRPFLYSVTDEFMDAFKLLSLDELPDLPEFNKEEGNDDLFQ